MFVLLCRLKVEERRRSTCSPCRRADEAKEPKTGTGTRVVRPFSLVGVRSGYPMAGRPMNILFDLLGHR